MKNTQKVTEKSKESNILRNNSQVYLEEALNFRIEGEIAFCLAKNCQFKTNDFFEAEDHWYKIHNIW